MKTYRLSVYSTPIEKLTIIAGLFSGAAISIPVSIYTESLALGLTSYICLFGAAFYLSRTFSRAKADFSISDRQFIVHWTKHFPVKSCSDCDLQISELKEYVFEFIQAKHRLKIKTVAGKHLKFEFTQTKRDTDDFMQFINDFQRSINDYNNKDNDVTNDIRIGKTYWQLTGTKIAAVFCASVLIFVWLDILVFHFGSRQDNLSKIVFGTIAGSLLIGKVIIENINPKK